MSWPPASSRSASPVHAINISQVISMGGAEGLKEGPWLWLIMWPGLHKGEGKPVTVTGSRGGTCHPEDLESPAPALTPYIPSTRHFLLLWKVSPGLWPFSF